MGNERKERRKAGTGRIPVKKYLLAAAVLLGILLFAAASTPAGIRALGKNHLSRMDDTLAGNLGERPFPVNGQGKNYRYREHLINILCMGIDKEEVMSERDDDGNSIGQADAVFLVSMDPDADEIRILAIPRDTMVGLTVCNEKGDFMGACDGQLALQYAFGDGQELSACLVKDCVEELLCGIPIHGMAAVNLSCIPVINDAVGGVEITMDEDYTLYHPAFKKGETVRLTGQAAVNFIQGRDITQEGSAYERIFRQKQYLNAFLEQAKTAFAADWLLPFALMRELEDNMITDLDMAEIFYLASEAPGFGFCDDGLKILPGEIKMGEKYEEYYIDEEAAGELILELFYEEI